MACAWSGEGRSAPCGAGKGVALPSGELEVGEVRLGLEAGRGFEVHDCFGRRHRLHLLDEDLEPGEAARVAGGPGPPRRV